MSEHLDKHYVIAMAMNTLQGFQSLLHCHSHLSPWTLCPHKVLTSAENPCLFRFYLTLQRDLSMSSFKSSPTSPAAGLQSQSSFQHTACRFSQCRPGWSFLASDKRCDRCGIFASPLGRSGNEVANVCKCIMPPGRQALISCTSKACTCMHYKHTPILR